MIILKEKGLKDRKVVFVLEKLSKKEFEELKMHDYNINHIVHNLDDNFKWLRDIFAVGQLTDINDNLLYDIFGFESGKWKHTGKWRHKVTYQVVDEDPKDKNYVRLMSQDFNPNFNEFKEIVGNIEGYGIILKYYGTKRQEATAST